jgi:hypothetical protein
MLNETDLLKMATEEIVEDERNKKTPIRNAYDAVTNGAKAVGGGIVAGIGGIASLENPAPIKTIN